MDSCSSEDEQIPGCSPCSGSKELSQAQKQQGNPAYLSRSWQPVRGALMPLPTCSSSTTDQESSDNETDCELQLVFSNIDWSSMEQQQDATASANLSVGRQLPTFSRASTTHSISMSPSAVTATTSTQPIGSQTSTASTHAACPPCGMQAAAADPESRATHASPNALHRRLVAPCADVEHKQHREQAVQPATLRHAEHSAACMNSGTVVQSTCEIGHEQQSGNRHGTTAGHQFSLGVGWLSGAAGRLSDLSSPRCHQEDVINVAPNKAYSATGTAADSTSSCYDQDHGWHKHQQQGGQEQGHEGAGEEAALTAAFHAAINHTRQSEPGTSSTMMLDDVAGVSMSDLDALIARLQRGEVNMDLATTRPSDLPDPSTLFSDSEDDGETPTPTVRTRHSTAGHESATGSKGPATAAGSFQAKQMQSSPATQPQLHQQDQDQHGLKPVRPSSAQQQNSTLAAVPARVTSVQSSQQAVASTVPACGRQPSHMPVALPPRFRALAAGHAMPATSSQPAVPPGALNAPDGLYSCSLQEAGQADKRATVVVDLRGHQHVSHSKSQPAAARSAAATALPVQSAPRSTRSTFVCCSPPDATGNGTGNADPAYRQALQVEGTATAAVQQAARRTPQPAKCGALRASSSSKHASSISAGKERGVQKMIPAQMGTEWDGAAVDRQAVCNGMRVHDLPDNAPGQLVEPGTKLVPAGLRIPISIWTEPGDAPKAASHTSDAATGCDDLPSAQADTATATSRPRCAGGALVHARVSDAAIQSDQCDAGLRPGLSGVSLKQGVTSGDVHQDHHDGRWLVGVNV